MTIQNLIAITAIIIPVLLSAMVFAFWLGKKIISLEVNQNSMREDLKSYIKLYFNDERLVIEKRFDEIEKIINSIRTEVQSNRHNINSQDMRLKHLEKK